MKLFIDTNIYLSYFRKSNESLSSLRELEKLLKIGKLKLILPCQTRDEYFCNRNNIAEQSRELLLRESEVKFNLPAPFVKEWKEAKTLRKRIESVKKSYKGILKKYDKQVGDEETPADILIKKLFSSATVLEDDEQLLHSAYMRYLRGHPPKKNDGSYGDAIAWELLLAKASDENLAVVTKDGDFIEKRKGKISFNGFLEREWKEKSKGKKVRLYDSLGEFINTLEKKETVKEKIVQEEKSSYTVVGGGTDFLSRFSSGAYASSVEPVGYVGSLPLAAQWGSTVGYLQVHSKKTKFCPFCGKNIEPYLPVSGIAPMTVVGISQNLFRCPQCGNTFEPDKIA